MHAMIVGLTGGIGSGKTTVANLFSEHGIHLVDADLAARHVVARGTPALAAIARHFGDDYLHPDGSLDRAALRRAVFADDAERVWLEQLLHPLIRRRITEQLAAASSPYTLLVSPLLLETDQHALCDYIIVVDVPESVQLTRASQRDASSERETRRIIASQMPRQQRLARANAVIDNSGDRDRARVAVDKLHRELLHLAASRPSLSTEQKSAPQ